MTCHCFDPRFHLRLMYGETRGSQAATWLDERLKVWQTNPALMRDLQASDAMLAVPANLFQSGGEAPLHGLAQFAKRRWQPLFSGLHLLPFFPHEGSDPFDILDARQPDPSLGSWQDVHDLSTDFEVLLDAELNHTSAGHPWFQAFLNNDPAFANFYVTLQPQADLSPVFRPVESALLTPYAAAQGEQMVWTTFRPDLPDLNYREPRVLLDMLDQLMFWVERGASYLRINHVPYLWKQSGTSCIHQTKAHLILNFIRGVLNEAAPHVRLVVESGFSQSENFRYFGNGLNAAHMLVSSALPALLLYALAEGDARPLRKWCAELTLPSPDVTYLNSLSCPRGIDLLPVNNLLSRAKSNSLRKRLHKAGLFSVSPSTTSGEHLPLNLHSALAALDPHLASRRLLAAWNVLLTLVGLPEVDAASLLEIADQQQVIPSNGRSRFDAPHGLNPVSVAAALDQPGSPAQQQFSALAHMMKVRGACSAFSPGAPQMTLDSGSSAVLGLLRFSLEDDDMALCLHNLSAQPQSVQLSLSALSLPDGNWVDLLTRQPLDFGDSVDVQLDAYQSVWLSPA
jgi:sucrose phosphorylase